VSALVATRIAAPEADRTLDDLAYPGAQVLVLRGDPPDQPTLEAHLRRLLKEPVPAASPAAPPAAGAEGWLVAIRGRRDDLRFAAELAESAGTTLEPIAGAGLAAAVGDGHPLLEALLDTGGSGGATVSWLRVAAPQQEEAMRWLRRGDTAAAAARCRWVLQRRGVEPWAVLALPHTADPPTPAQVAGEAASVAAAVGRAEGPATRRRLALLAGAVGVAVLVVVAAVRSGSGGTEKPPPVSAPTSAPTLGGPPVVAVPAHVGPAPVARQLATAAWDASRGRLVLFGGSALSGPTADLSDTWTWDGRSWTQALLTRSPQGRFGAVMADDGAGGLLLFGGTTREPGPPHALTDTWRWDGATWTLVDAGTGGEVPGRPQAMVDDRASGQILLLAAPADAPAGPLLTWVWTGSSWRQEHPETPAPQVRLVAYDSARGQLVAVATDVTGLGPGSTWRWDGSTWNQLHPSRETEVEPLTASMAFDPATRTIVLVEQDFTTQVGNVTGDRGGTWTWDGITWSRRDTPTPAFVRVLDPTASIWAYPGGSLVLLGGSSGGFAYRSAAAWDGDSWQPA